MSLGLGVSGVQNTADGGLGNPIRLGQQADQIVSELHGRYYENTVRGKRFGAAMQAVLATATIAGLNTAITGTSVVANPTTSTVNLVLDKFGVGFVLAPAASLAYGIAIGQSTTALSGTLTSLAPRNLLVGGAAPVGTAFASAAITLPVAPTVAAVLGSASVTVVANTLNWFDLEGSIVLPPGGFAVFWTSAVLAASAHIASWMWEEVPILR